MAFWDCLWRAISLVVNIATVLYNSCRFKTKQTGHQFATNEQIAEQATYLCEKYIQDRFQRTGNKSSSSYKCTVLNDPLLVSDQTVATLCQHGRLLEAAYPSLYNNVSGQLNFRINLEIVVCGMFTCVCDNILASGITWARIVSLYAFAAALAAECCQCDVRIAKNISKWMGQYTHKRLSGWVRDHGGWEAMAVHFGEEKCTLVISVTRWLNKASLALSLGAFTGIAGLLTLWTGS